MAGLLGHILVENTPWPSRNSFAALSMSVRSRAMGFCSTLPLVWSGLLMREIERESERETVRCIMNDEGSLIQFKSAVREKQNDRAHI